MNKQQFAPFFVGQEVEAVKGHSQGAFVKGERFLINSIYKSSCCGRWLVNIGIKSVSVTRCCHSCKSIIQSKNEWGFSAFLFRAITPAMEAVTFEKITEQHPVSVN